ncbi:MAG: ParB N-terminal domain-containing protein [Anaerolineaceae bacterium]|nr:ParB N-terminal domain-containing protein [Anaerolineaceae bacterium]
MATEIPIDQIQPHPENSNVMTDAQVAKLQRHLKRSGRYEPLVVRPLTNPNPNPDPDGGPAAYQVLNGHHRLRVLGRLGHKTVRCEVWEVDDREALLLLATLNRLEGRDDPLRRAALLAHLAHLADPSAGDPGRLARLLPEDRAALDRALALARRPLPAPTPPKETPAPLRPMTFFLQQDDHRTVERAIRLARKNAAPQAAGEAAAEGLVAANAAGCKSGGHRAAALLRLAHCFLSCCSAKQPAAQHESPPVESLGVERPAGRDSAAAQEEGAAP